MSDATTMRHAPLSGYSVAHFEHALHKPFRSGRGVIRSRSGYLVRMERDGRVGFGELSPLPGFHVESVEESMRSLVEALACGGTPKAPSAAFALSCAECMTDAGAAERFNFVTPARVPSVRVNALFGGDAVAAEAAWKSGAFTGFRTIKLKVGRGSVEDDVALVAAFRSRMKPEQRIRLDANRMMEFDAAERLLEAIGPDRIEYAEEPLRDPSRMPELARKTGIPMAIDETLRDADLAQDVLGAEGVIVQVVKPSLIGDLGELESVVTQGTINGCDTVFSNLFESAFTLALLGRVAAILGAEDRDHGLATAGLFDADWCARPHIDGGRMFFDSPLPTPRLPWTPLEEWCRSHGIK